MHIGVLDDDLDQCDFLQHCLMQDETRVSTYQRASELNRALLEQPFDLLIIDWHLPDASGMDLVDQLRRHHGWEGPILFITASDAEEHVVRALEKGADDFLAKPLRPSELRARVGALARRAGLHAPASPNRIGAYRLDHDNHRIHLDGREIRLTEREFRLASLLFSRIGQLFSRANILELVWGIRADVSTRTVDTHISRLRHKLELDGSHGLRLKSVYQHGYRLERRAE
ncbi:MAG: two component transcriptional regulator [Halomonadaceae bacterium T82-2]|nr:MAG: two component transcriptional regulator [Halomonadaceae bacterium T82-2]